MLAYENFDSPRVWDSKETLSQNAQKVGLLTRPTLAVTSPARPESAKTVSLPRDTPCPRQGRSSVADPRFTFHASRLLGAMRERGWQIFQHPARTRRAIDP